jgi:uncharacterized repeat protein (TIGR01451 family)
MRSWLGRILVALCLGVISAGHSQPALAFTNGAAANLVLGQTDFITGTAGTTSATMDVPTSVAVDATTGKVFVADGGNNRVLRFASLASLSNGSAAEAVLGQPNFTSSSTGTGLNGMSFPFGVHVDSGGRLWVADASNNRVLRFDNAATLASGASADAFLGTGAVGCSSATLNAPAALYTDSSGGLWVADANNNRVLRFANAATLANSASASTVFGQPNFATCIVAAASATSLNGPQSVYFDSGGRLWVADTSNNRVLRFDSASSLGNFPSASGVLGQPDFTSALAAVSQTGMNAPIGVVGDAEGRLYVSDAANNRVLIHDDAAAESNGAPAANVLGQTDFTTSTSGLTASTLNFPERLAFDNSLDVLLVADADNNRVLGFTIPTCQITVSKMVAKDDNCDAIADGPFGMSVTQDITKCVVYQICVNNTGTTAVNNILVGDSSPPGGTLNFGTLAGGASSCQLVPTNALIGTCSGGTCVCPALGTTTDTATLTLTCDGGADACTQPGSNCSDKASVTCEACQITVDKTVAADNNCDGIADVAFANSVTQDSAKCVVYKICVNNSGTEAVDNVQVTDSSPPGGTLNFGTVPFGGLGPCQLVPTDAKIGDCSAGTCICPAPGTTTDTATLTGTCAVGGDDACIKAGSKCTDTADVTCTGGTTTTSTTTTTSSTTTTSTTTTTSSTTTTSTTTTTTPSTTTTLPDHFQCYEVRPQAFPAIRGVSVVDQFGSHMETVRFAHRLCAPADKNGEFPDAPTDPDHLIGHLVTAPRVRVLNQTVVNQFGTVKLDVIRPDVLMVPTLKSVTAPPPPLPQPSIDHFQCYKVKPSQGAPPFTKILGVKVHDQFETAIVDLLKPVTLCAPANKRGEDPSAPDHPSHLLCYQTKQAPFPATKTFTNSQFGPAQPLLIHRRELCVPSLKDPGATTTTTTSTTTTTMPCGQLACVTNINCGSCPACPAGYTCSCGPGGIQPCGDAPICACYGPLCGPDCPLCPPGGSCPLS